MAEYRVFNLPIDLPEYWFQTFKYMSVMSSINSSKGSIS